MYSATTILKKYDLIIKKKFGQNFLTDPNILIKIANVPEISSNSNVLEIGPGPGGLTDAILNRNPKSLIAIEIDRDYYDILKKEFAERKNFTIFNDDALKIKEEDFFKEKINIVANLPYNIGTALLLKWIRKINLFESFTLLLQKEVVDRIVAKPCTKEYGRLSIIIQALTSAKKIFDLKPTSFIPPPKVTSSVIHIVPKKTNINIEKLFDCTAILFAQRRKKIKKTIENLKKNKKINENFSIDLNKRPEELTVDEFIEISNNF